MNSYLATLITAVSQVPPYIVSNCLYKEKNDKIGYINERGFAYELYRQWQNLVEDNPDDLVVNAEVAKKTERYEEILTKIYNTQDKEILHTCFYPDLVYHHSQFDSIAQEIICEIKTIDRLKKIKKSLLWDIEKLAAFMENDLLILGKFNIGVFILVGGDFSQIKEILTEVIDDQNDNICKIGNNIYERINEIYCITYNIKEEKELYLPEVLCETIEEILKRKT